MIKSKLIMTRMMKWYLLKFAVRIAIFVFVLLTYLFHKQWLVDMMTRKFFAQYVGGYGFNILQVLWVMFMVMMIRHLFPKDFFTMALRKGESNTYDEKEGYQEIELLHFVQRQNLRSWIVLLVWLLFNAVFALLYLIGILDSTDLLMLTVFYFLCDYICILLFCPFQSFIMKNRCCVNCRIYDWGHFMMFTPMLFIRNFFSWSLFFTSLVVLIRWEIVYAMHPERFWNGSNKTIQCQNCKDKTCQIKKKVTKTILGKPYIIDENS